MLAISAKERPWRAVKKPGEGTQALQEFMYSKQSGSRPTWTKYMEWYSSRRVVLLWFTVGGPLVANHFHLPVNNAGFQAHPPYGCRCTPYSTVTWENGDLAANHGQSFGNIIGLQQGTGSSHKAIGWYGNQLVLCSIAIRYPFYVDAMTRTEIKPGEQRQPLTWPPEVWPGNGDRRGPRKKSFPYGEGSAATPLIPNWPDHSSINSTIIVLLLSPACSIVSSKSSIKSLPMDLRSNGTPSFPGKGSAFSHS